VVAPGFEVNVLGVGATLRAFLPLKVAERPRRCGHVGGWGVVPEGHGRGRVEGIGKADTGERYVHYYGSWLTIPASCSFSPAVACHSGVTTVAV
jgi:hypothetical protein